MHSLPCLRQQYRRPGGLARLEIAVRLLRILERVLLIDRNLDLAARHHAEQVVGDRKQVLALGRIGVERRARAEERALLLQEIDIERLDRARGVAEAREHAERLDAVERLREGCLADAI